MEARYRAEYGGCFSFEYTVPMALERERADIGTDAAGGGAAGDATGALCRFSGSADLGWMAGGLYRYEGIADGKTFTATYSSASDHGVFRLLRPAPGE